MKSLIVVLLVFFAVLQYQLWFAKDGLYHLWHLKQQIALQESKNQGLKKRNAELLAEIIALKNGSSAIENRARNDLGMIKKGEVFYQFVK